LTARGPVLARLLPASAGPLASLLRPGRVPPARVPGPAPRPPLPLRGGLASGPLLARLRAAARSSRVLSLAPSA
ncbi:prevent-host-death family protein, partial [Mycobacterium tuberculosis]